MAKPSNNSAPAGRPLQWSDISAQGQRVVAANMNEASRTMRQRNAAAGARMASLATTGKSPASRNKAKVLANTHANLQPHLVNKGLTLDSAADSRVRSYEGAERSANERGRDVPDGTGWYFEHHRDIRDVAKQTGFDPSRAIVGSAVMSPNNSPDNEKAAIHEIMRAHAGGSIHVTSRVAAHLTRAGVPVNPDHVGRTVAVKDMHPHALAALSATSVRGDVEHSGFSLHQISRGGTRGNIAGALDVLHGHVDLKDAANNDPHSAPKVHSYAQNILHATPDSAIHDEYMFRVKHHTLMGRGEIHPNQTHMDIHGLANSEEGLLSSTRSTAEDTWQNALTFDQPNVSAGRTSVMKSGGSNNNYPAIAKTRTVRGKNVSAHPDSNIGPSAVQHAYNNEATRMAAEKISTRQYNAPRVGNRQGPEPLQVHPKVPIVAAQEVPWTQARRDTGKDPDWNRQQAAEAPEKPKNRSTGTISGQQFKFTQGQLF